MQVKTFSNYNQIEEEGSNASKEVDQSLANDDGMVSSNAQFSILTDEACKYLDEKDHEDGECRGDVHENVEPEVCEQCLVSFPNPSPPHEATAAYFDPWSETEELSFELVGRQLI